MMSASLRDLPAFLVSLVVHVLILVVLLLIPKALESATMPLSLETIFNEDRQRVEYSQELEVDTTVSESLSVVQGGSIATTVGANSTPPKTQVRVTESQALKEPTLSPGLNDVLMPSDANVADELGETQIAGETGAIVDGYGAAMHRITQELLRMMRVQKVLVVWLFDESESMRDDQKEIRDNFYKVYEELGIARSRAEKKKRNAPQALQTVIASYGGSVNVHTQRPTDELEKIKSAIDRIPVDLSGAENMCRSLDAVLQKYATMARGRKLAVVVVSDESGDDGQFVDDAIQRARRLKAPVYVLGRESIFGYPYTHQRWVHKETGLVFHPRIRRGPETAYPECLQWDGIHSRWDAFGAGFGPYEQVRLARDTGGIFFQLPGREADLAGRGSNDQRKFDALAMKQYEPLLLPRRIYQTERASSPFRATMWTVISSLNPVKNELLFETFDSKLNMRRLHFSTDLEEFKAEASTQVGNAARAMGLVNEALALMEGIKEQRATEGAERWRANYDLSYAQLVTFRIRLFQYLLAIDDHVNTQRMPQKEDSNEWNLGHNKKTIVPDEAQYARIQKTFGIKQSREEYLAMVADEERRATQLLKAVMAEHTGTPWARRAQYEIQLGFGHQFHEARRDPRYQTMRSQIKVPNL